MDISSVILIPVIRFLNLNDLARAAGACFEWWSVIKWYRLMEQDWEELDLSGTGKLYCVIPWRAFRSLTSLNLASTQLSNAISNKWCSLRQAWNDMISQTVPHWTRLWFLKPRNLCMNYSTSQFPAISSSQFWPSRVCVPAWNLKWLKHMD